VVHLSLGQVVPEPEALPGFHDKGGATRLGFRVALFSKAKRVRFPLLAWHGRPRRKVPFHKVAIPRR
jgi:hypothetical protein